MDIYDIPILFQVRGRDENDAADNLAHDLQAIPLSPDGEIESWHMPNHKEIDGSDAPVQLLMVPTDTCAHCGNPLYGVFRAHHHSENDKDVTR